MPVREASRRRRSSPAPAASRGAPLPALTARGRWLRARPAPLCAAPPRLLPSLRVASSLWLPGWRRAPSCLQPSRDVSEPRPQRPAPASHRHVSRSVGRSVGQHGAVALGRFAGAFGVFFLPSAGSALRPSFSRTPEATRGSCELLRSYVCSVFLLFTYRPHFCQAVCGLRLLLCSVRYRLCFYFALGFLARHGAKNPAPQSVCEVTNSCKMDTAVLLLRAR